MVSVNLHIFFYSDLDNNAMLTAVPIFLTFLPFMSVFFFCSHIVVTIMEFYTTGIQVRGLASDTTCYDPSFSS